MELPTFDLNVISGDQLVFRAFLNKQHFNVESGGVAQVTVTAFLRRENNDYRGLSVAPTERDSQKHLNTQLGCCCLVADEIRASHPGVDIKPDAEDHGNIVGVPRRSENPEIAFKIAQALEREANRHPCYGVPTTAQSA